MKKIKLSLVFIWTILIIALISREYLIEEFTDTEALVVEKARQEHYYGVWFKEKRIGYVFEELSPGPNNTFSLKQQALFNLTVLDSTQTVKMFLEARLDESLGLHDFSFRFHSPFYKMEATGKVAGKQISYTLDTGRSTIKDQLTLSQTPRLATNSRLYLLKKLSEKGDKIKTSSFDPVSLTGQESIIEYLGKEKVLIQSRVYNLHHFAKTFSGVRINFWLNDEGKVIKEQSAAGFEFLAEAKSKALDIASDTSELLSAVAVHFTGSIPEKNATSAIYQLTLPEDIEFDLIGGRQSLDQNFLTIRREQFSALTTKVQHNNFCQDDKHLLPSPYIQAKHPDIQTLAGKIIGSETDRLQQVKLLSKWLFHNLEKRPVIGLPDALTTLHTKKGDCNEHAALFAALARSLDIPTSIATGVTLHRGAFYYHAWNETCINGTRLSVDTTLNQVPADLTHIRIASGEMDQQIKIGALIGTMQIAILNDESRSEEPSSH